MDLIEKLCENKIVEENIWMWNKCKEKIVSNYVERKFSGNFGIRNVVKVLSKAQSVREIL